MTTPKNNTNLLAFFKKTSPKNSSAKEAARPISPTENLSSKDNIPSSSPDAECCTEDSKQGGRGGKSEKNGRVDLRNDEDNAQGTCSGDLAAPKGESGASEPLETDVQLRKRKRISHVIRVMSESQSPDKEKMGLESPGRKKRVKRAADEEIGSEKNSSEGGEERRKEKDDEKKKSDDDLDDEIEDVEDVEEIASDGGEDSKKEKLTKVSGNSEQGKAMLEALMKHADALSKPVKKKGPTTGSLYSQTTVTPQTPPTASDISSPAFDPSALDGAVLRAPAVRGKGLMAGKELKPSGEACGKGSLLFALIVEAFDRIEELKGSGHGSKKTAAVVLANTFRILLFHEPRDLVPAVYLCLNKVGPDYCGVEVGVGDALIIKALTEVYGRSESAIKKDLAESEDLGAVAASSRCQVRTLFESPRLTIRHVFNEMKELPNVTGQSSQTRKRDKVKKLLVAAKGNEPKYIVRFLQQKMRIGVQNATVYQALGFAFTLSPNSSLPSDVPNASEGLPSSPSSKTSLCLAATPEKPNNKFCADIRRKIKIYPKDLELQLAEMEFCIRAAHCELPNIELIINHLLNGASSKDLSQLCVATPGIPVQPMLAKPSKGLGEVFERFANCTFSCEFKYDGERAQIHKLKDGSIKVFSRNLEEMTGKYPDVRLIAQEALEKVEDGIIDSEVVAFDVAAQKILPFQVLQGRKRKDVSTEDVKIKVCVFAFDCIHLNGTPLIRKPLSERRRLLKANAVELPQKFTFARHAEMQTMEDVDAFLQDAIDGACEGLMVKTLEENASYEPSKRSLNWLKVKKDYLEGLGDSVDLVPIGAFHGRGKRSKVYGAFLLAVYCPVNDTFQTVCKAGTGFSEEQLQQHFEFLRSHLIPNKRRDYEVHDRLSPDVWFDTSQVWECKAADLSISPVHTAALSAKSPDRGIGLRFPRFLRIRADKKPEHATTDSQILEMYDSQFSGGAAGKGVVRPEDLEDYEESSGGEDES